MVVNEVDYFVRTLLRRYGREQDRVLDVGCGPAPYREWVLGEYIGLDVTDRPYKTGLPRRVDVVGSAAALPLAAGSIDLIFSKSAFYLLPNPEAALEEFLRVLKAGGRMLLFDYNRRTQSGMMKVDGSRLPCWTQWVLLLTPTHAVVTNIDPEHLDYFKTVENMHREFETFFQSIPFYGLTVTCIDHPVVAQMIERLALRRDGRRLLTYGTSPAADLVLKSTRVEGAVTFFDAELGGRVRGGGRTLEGWSVPIPGEHNALNALAAIAVASEAEIGDDVIRQAIAGFSGVKRRFQLTGTWNGVAIYDDYGHHPVEIAAVLKAARAGAHGRVIAVVEPHRFTRVRDLFADFAACFKDADSVIVTPLYSAGELPIEGIDHTSLAEAIRAEGHKAVVTVGSEREIAPALKSFATSGDIVICLGAGNSTEWAHALPDWLAGEPKRAGGKA
jgi:UDP-N-acetylmuramate-alanine ligase